MNSVLTAETMVPPSIIDSKGLVGQVDDLPALGVYNFASFRFLSVGRRSVVHGERTKSYGEIAAGTLSLLASIMSDGFVASSAFEPIANSFSTNVFNDPFATATSLDIDNPSPELVKQNIQIVKNQVLHLQNIASNALDGIRNAYHAGANPIDTESNIGTLKQNLESLSELMRRTGLGGLPLLSLASSPPSEEQMMLDVSQSINVLYARLKKNQESAGVVANLLQQAFTVPLRK